MKKIFCDLCGIETKIPARITIATAESPVHHEAIAYSYKEICPSCFVQVIEANKNIINMLLSKKGVQ